MDNNDDNNKLLSLVNSDIEQKISNKNKKNKYLKIYLILAILLIIILIVLIIFLISKKHNKNKKNSFIIRLNNWSGCSNKSISLSGEEISSGKYNDIVDKAFINAPPEWTVVTAMGLLNGESLDIFFENNLNFTDKTQFDDNWYFKSYFDLENINKNSLILLHIHGINYQGELYIDGKKYEEKIIIGTFIKYSIDITNYLDYKKKTHIILFSIKRPHNQWGGKQYENETDLSISFVDWNPEAPDSNMGIWQPVDVEIFESKAITVSSSLITTIYDDKNDIADVSIRIILYNWGKDEYKLKGNFSIGEDISCDFSSLNKKIEPQKEEILDITSDICSFLKIKNPKLWWPYQMGTPYLYNLTIYIDSPYPYYYTKLIGLREVSSELSSDKKKRVYLINKKKLLLKGAGWTPDLFLRMSSEKYLKHINYVKDMGLNVIRLEGKFEHDEFYSLCDEYGILIIDGFNCGDAWQRWKRWSEYVLSLAKESLKSLLRKLSIHPSLLIFIQGSDYPPIDLVEIEFNKIFDSEKWPNQILTSATGQISDVSGHTGVKMTGPYSWVPPHYFYFDENETYGGFWGFLTEGGPGENPLRYGSYNLTFKKENIKWPLNESIWYYHCGNVVSKFSTLNFFLTPIEERFGKIKNFEDFQKKSMITVYDSHRAMFEAYIINRYTSTGLIHWMLNNAWPGNIWHLYDYYFNPTPSYFAVKKANEKIHALYNYNNSSIYLVNNYFQKCCGVLNMSVFLFDENGIEFYNNNFTFINCLKGDYNKFIIKFNERMYKTNVIFLHIIIEYKENKKEDINYSSNTYLLNKEMDIMNYTNSSFYNVGILKYANFKIIENLKKTEIKINNIKTINLNDTYAQTTFEIQNVGNTLAFVIEIFLINKNNNKLYSPIFYNDNYFSLKPSEKNNINIIYKIEENINNDPLIKINGWNTIFNNNI